MRWDFLFGFRLIEYIRIEYGCGRCCFRGWCYTTVEVRFGHWVGRGGMSDELGSEVEGGLGLDVYGMFWGGLEELWFFGCDSVDHGYGYSMRLHSFWGFRVEDVAMRDIVAFCLCLMKRCLQSLGFSYRLQYVWNVRI